MSHQLVLFLKYGEHTKRVSIVVPSVEFLIGLCREKFSDPTIHEAPSEHFAFWIQGL
jgi:hypothetical protein